MSGTVHHPRGTWVKLPDTTPDQPEVAGLSDAAFRLHITGLCYCSKLLTDGSVPDAVVARWGIRNHRKTAAELEAVGLWERTDQGWEIVDYLAGQRSRAEAEELSAKRATAGQKGGKASAKAKQVAKQTASKREAEVERELETENLTPPTPPSASTELDHQSAAPTARGGDYPTIFEDCWASYPRKTNKRGAYKAWQARIRAGAKPRDLLTATAHYAAHRSGQEDRYTLHGSTFYGPDDRWRDFLDPTAARPPASPEPERVRLRREMLERVQADERNAGIAALEAAG